MSPTPQSSPSSSSRQSIGQVQGLRQQQTLSPQQLLYMRLLELNTLEIEDEVHRTLEENPALEVVDDDVMGRDHDELQAMLPPQESYDDGASFNESAEDLQRADFMRGEDVPFALPDHGDAPSFSREAPDTAAGSSVMEYLEAQIAELPLTPKQRVIASQIAGNVDDNGYLTATPRQIADGLSFNDGMDVTVSDVNSVLDAMRSLDPPGICAVDLRDCLLIQLRHREKTDRSPSVAIAREMIADFFDLFSKRHFDKLCSALGISREELKKAIEVVRSLNPKPGAIISGSRGDELSNQITPDFFVETDGHNIELQMNNSLPALRIESSFDIDDAPLPSKRKGAADAMAFIRSRRDDAAAYIHAIDLRRQTLYRIMRAIISIQRDFFLSDGDRSTLRPMILKDVAAITGDDISVVSRATAGKYVATRYGTYPLKFFFNEAPSAESSDSSIKIIETIRALVAAENPSDPLSDEALTTMLHEKGYNIARRTVAKYREKAAIPVARLRRHLD